MGQQSEIFARYRSLFSSKDVSATESDLSRQLDNMDFVDFLFELVKATKGQSQYKNIILKGSITQLKKTDEINETIVKALFSAYGCDSTLIIKTQYTTKSSTGVSITRSEIDNFGLLSIDPNGSPGRFLYEGNDVTKHINYLLYKAQGVTVSNPISFNYSGRILFTIGSSSPNTFIFKFGDYYENQPFGNWLSDYLKACSPIFNNVNFMTILTDLLTGAISLTANKTQDEIQQQSSIIVALQKLFGFCSESNSDDSGSPNTSANNILNNQQNSSSNYNGDGLTGSQTGFGNLLNSLNGINSNSDGTTTGSTQSTIPNPFDFDFSDLEQINTDATNRANGVVVFRTCGNLELSIDPNDMISGLDTLFSNSNFDDTPYSYDGSINNQLPSTNGSSGTSSVSGSTAGDTGSYDNSLVEPNVVNATNFFDNALTQGATNALNSGETNVVIDLPNMNAELQLNILKAIPYALMQMVLSPKVLLVPKLHAVLSGDDSTKSISDFVNSMTPVINKIGTAITNMLINNIFDSIKSDLINLAKDLAVSFLKQRGLDYVATLTSLLSILNLFSGGSSGCGGVLDKLLKLLKLANFGPMPMVPPPLILVGGAIKPGLNSVSIFNDIKSNLTEKGIETAPTLPDGTPNNMMIAIEETVKTITTHIKTNAAIQTFGICAVGPVQGYGQIQ